MSYWIKLHGDNAEILGPFPSKDSVMSWYEEQTYWKGIKSVEVLKQASITERHLNWSFFLGLLGLTVIAIIPYTLLERLEGPWVLAGFIPAILVLIASLYIHIWYLRKKNRSLWLLGLMLLSTIGLIWFLWLNNKS